MLLPALAALLIAAPASSADDDLGERLGLRVRAAAEHGRSRPAILLTPALPIATLVIELERSGGTSETLRGRDLRPGREHGFEFDQPLGEHSFEATARGTFAGGERFELPFAFDSISFKPLKLDLRKEDVCLDERRITIRLNREVERIEYVVTADGGKVVARGQEPPSAPPGRPMTITWEGGGEVTERISLKARDRHGFWVGVEVTPFSVFIPHDEVEFETGKWSIRPSETPKLQDTLRQIREALALHGRELDLQLYIAGYTDTVGSRSSNQILSERRARAIAGWFRAQGVGVPVYYQGFGQDVLAVATPDQTAEKRNRRALYVLSAGPPSQSPAIPRDAWKSLP